MAYETKTGFWKDKMPARYLWCFTKLDSEKETADEKFENLMKHLGK